jgi:2'-5' RNA ligase
VAEQWWEQDAPVAAEPENWWADDAPANLAQTLETVYEHDVAGSPWLNLAPNLYPAAVAGGAGIAAPVLRMFGQDDEATRLQARASALGKASEQLAQQSTDYPIVPRAVRGVVASLPTAKLGAKLGGAYGSLGAAGVSASDSAYHEARVTGMPEEQAVEYAKGQGVIEFGVGAVFQKLGLGGLESVLASKTPAVQGGIREALKRAGVNLVNELGEEHVTEIAHAVQSKLTGVDPNALSPEAMQQLVADTTAQTILTMGLVEAPGLIDAATGRREDTRAENAQVLPQNQPVSQENTAEDTRAESSQVPSTFEGLVTDSVSANQDRPDVDVPPEDDPAPGHPSDPVTSKIKQMSDQELGSLLAEVDSELDAMDLDDVRYDSTSIYQQLLNNEVRKRSGRDLFTTRPVDAAPKTDTLSVGSNSRLDGVPSSIEGGDQNVESQTVPQGVQEETEGDQQRQGREGLLESSTTAAETKVATLEPTPLGDATSAPSGVSIAPTEKEPPIVRHKRRADEVTSAMAPIPEGHSRLWRGNRKGEVGKNPQFTTSLEGIALPFQEAYGGDLSYVDVPTADLGKYELKTGVAPGAEFKLPLDLAAKAQIYTKPETPNAAPASPQPSGVPETAPQAGEEVGDPRPAREFSSTQVNLPGGFAKKVRDAGKQIADEDLAEKGRESEPHVTVKFGLHTNDVDEVRPLIESEPPIRLKLGKTSTFAGGENGDVVKVDVDSEDLRRINAAITAALPHTDTHPDYKPHVTLGYVKPGLGQKYAGRSDLEGTEIVLDRIVFSDKERNHHEIKLLGGKRAAPRKSADSVSVNRDYGSVEQPNRVTLGEHFGERLVGGAAYPGINEARKEASELLGGDVKPGRAITKHVDEAIEQGVVRAAREIIRSAKTAAEAYDALVDLYGRQPNLSVRTSTSMAQQAYSTPAPLAYLAGTMADVRPGQVVYDATAGNGMLLITGNEGHARANELNPDRAAATRAMGIQTSENDATQFRPKIADKILLNPPFGKVSDADGNDQSWTIDGVTTNQVDHAIALNSLQALPTDGKAVLILGAKGGRETDQVQRAKSYSGAGKTFYDKVYDTYNVVDHFTVSGDLYSRQGAGFPVDVIVIDGKGGKSRPRPWNFKAGGLPQVYSSWEDLKRDKLKAGMESWGSRTGSASPGGREGTDLAGVPEPAPEAAPATKPETQQPGGDVQPGVVGPDGVGSRPAPGKRPSKSPRNRPVRGDAEQRPSPEPEQLPKADQTERGESGGDGDVRPGVLADGGSSKPEVVTDNVSVKVKKKVTETEFQTGYEPQSSLASLETLLPKNHVDAVRRSLEAVQEKYGDIDKFVAKELGFTPAQLSDAFAAEQVDALALAIANHKIGEAFIIGDQTGVGKGRAAAGMIRYAQRQGLLPVFVTEKPDLYADMLRDLTDIGVNTPKKPFNILATNDFSDAESRLPLPDGRELRQTGKQARQQVEEAVKSFNSGKGLKAKVKGGDVEYGALFTTYSQLQSVKGEQTWRTNAMNDIRDKAYFILDESHNAGGSANERTTQFTRAEFVRHMISEAPGVYYSSATFAKRYSVMDLYAKTGMGRAVDKPEDLPEAIKQGGVPLQQIVSEMLAEAGQYLRREKSFEGIEFQPKVVEIDLKQADNVSAIFRAIRDFDDAKEGAVAAVEENVVSAGGGMGNDNSTGDSGVTSTNFSSILWNIVDQQLMALKADKAADEAIEAWKAGKVPVIGVDNTMEAALGYYLEANPTKKGERIGFTFKSVLQRYLDRSREILIKHDKDDPSTWERHRLTDAELGPDGVAAYKAVQDLIDAFDAQIPASPIDWMRYRLEKAGMKVAEITGRSAGIDYGTGDMSGGLLWERPADEKGIGGKARTIAAINAGKLDAVILNRSGATGVSLHASAKFKNQKQRHMIIAQSAKNIDEFMQLLGRINRTGQVEKPKYTLLLSNAPAENRPAAVLVKKLSSLNANVTASSKGAVGFDVPDIINEIGNQVVAEFLTEHPSLSNDLGTPINENGTPLENLGTVSKATGRMALMPIEVQEEFWEELTRLYQQRIDELNAQGVNPLVAQTLPLAAKTLERFPLFDGNEESSNPFEQPAYLEKVSAKKVAKPFTSAEVSQRVAEFYGLEGDLNRREVYRAQSRWSEKAADELRERMADFARKRIAEAKTDVRAAELKEMFQDQFATVSGAFRQYAPGTTISFASLDGAIPGVVTGFRQTGKAKNPGAPSSWVADIALADAIKKITIPTSQLGTRSATVVATSEDLTDAIAAFDEAATTAREDRYIATGNLLAGFSTLSGQNGRIVFFTDESGATRRGVLMPAKFDPVEWQEKRPVAFEDPKKAMQFLEASGMLWAPDKSAWVTMAGGRLIVKTAKSKAKGGKYTLNKKLLAAASPDEFVSKGAYMEMVVPGSKAKAVLTQLMEISGLQANEAKEIARKILGVTDTLSVKARKKADKDEGDGDRPASYGFLGAARGDRVIDDRIAPKAIQAEREEVERQLQASYGAKPEGFVKKLAATAKAAGKAATRAQQEIPTDAAHATMNEMFRLAKQFAPTAQDEANRNIAAITANLGPQQLQLFTRKLILDNLLASIDRGEPLRFGFKDRAEVVEYKAKLDDLADATPAVKEALDLRRGIAREIVEKLVSLELLPPDAIKQSDTYYHQQVLSYLGASRLGRNPQITKRGFQKARTKGVEEFDESLNYNTSYIEAEHEWMRDALNQIQKEEWLGELKDRFDIKEAMQEFASDADADWRELVRQSGTHKIWQAAPGNVFYRAVGVAEHVIEDVLAGIEDTAEVSRDDLRNILSMGGPQREMVLPNELVDQLETMQAQKGTGNAFGDGIEWLSKEMQRMWKTWTLFSPLRAFAYNLRNITGDIDPVIGGAPGVLAHTGRAIRELSGYFGIRGKPSLTLTDELQKARDLGVIDSSLTASEIPDLKDLEVFRRFYASDRQDLARTVKNYFDTVKRFSSFRESIARYAAFLYYKKALDAGNLSHYGGARKEIVDRLAAEMGTDVAAAHLARNLLGDYGDLTTMGNFLREHLIPFFSWQEVNLKRYPMIFYNAALYGHRAAADNPAKAAGLTAAALASTMLPYVAMQLFNHLLWPDEEDELSDDERASPHVILGRNPDGSIRILRNTGALGDWLENFGVNTMISRLDELRAGQMNGKDLMLEVAKDAVNKQVQGVRPDMKALWEIPSGQSIYPNVFTPRPVRRDDQLAGYLGLTDPYREARGRAMKTGARSRPNFMARTLGVTDPRKNALFEITELRDRFLEKLGENKPFRGNELVANMRDAASAGNQEAFEEARLAYLNKDGDYEKFKRSTGSLDPIHQRLNDADEKKFEQEYLTPDQRDKLGRARDYARELEVSMWKMWHEAAKSDPPEIAKMIRVQQTKEAVTLAKKVLSLRPVSLTAKEREEGLTLPQKRQRWEETRGEAQKALQASTLGKDAILEAVRTWTHGELKEASSKAERMSKFRREMKWYGKVQ